MIIAAFILGVTWLVAVVAASIYSYSRPPSVLPRVLVAFVVISSGALFAAYYTPFWGNPGDLLALRAAHRRNVLVMKPDMGSEIIVAQDRLGVVGDDEGDDGLSVSIYRKEQGTWRWIATAPGTYRCLFAAAKATDEQAQALSEILITRATRLHPDTAAPLRLSPSSSGRCS